MFGFFILYVDLKFFLYHNVLMLKGLCTINYKVIIENVKRKIEPYSFMYLVIRF